MMQVTKRRYVGTWLVLGAVLLLSLLVMLQSFGLFDTAGHELQIARIYALDLAEYNLQKAEDLGIPRDNNRVALAYGGLVNNINNAATAQEIYHIVLTEMGRFEHTVIREVAEKALVDSWASIISNAGLGPDTVGEEIVINIGADRTVEIEGGEFLGEETREKLSESRIPDALRLQTVVFLVAEVSEEGDVVIQLVQHAMEQDPIVALENQYRFWEQELYSLLSAAGHSELTGPGLIIRLQDAENITDRVVNIVHDYDVQEVVSYLNSAGAQGIAVGNFRLTSTSSIRCVGPLIQVDNEYIPVDPVEIAVVGDPDELGEALEPLLQYFRQRELQVVVEVRDELRLPAFRRR